MAENLRIRLKFDSTQSTHSQKCWFIFDGEKCKLVSDVRHLIASRFNLKKPQGIQLYMDDFLIPANESAKVIRDNDILQVRAIQTIHDSSSSSDESSSDASHPKSKKVKVETKPKQTKTKSVTAQAKLKTSAAAKKSGVEPSTSTSSAKKLVGVTTQSAMGALHTKFRSSSSSDSSSGSSSSSSSSSGKQDDGKKPNTAAKNVGRGRGISKRGTQWDKRGSWSSRGGIRGGLSARGRNWNMTGRNTCPDLVVGGPNDTLTTRSTIYSRGRGRRARTRENLQMVVSAVQETLGKQILDKSTPMQSPLDRQGSLENTKSVDQDSLEQPSVPDVEIEPPPDYSACAKLDGPPREGDSLAFKVLELSSTYSPEVSDFKEGTVLEYDSTTDMVKVKFSESYLKRQAKKVEANVAAKFELNDEEQEDSDAAQEQISEAQFKFTELIEPKLLTCTPINKNA